MTRRSSFAEFLLKSAAITALSTGLIAAPVFSQDDGVETTPGSTQNATDDDDRIIVTGSRLTNQFTSDSPIDVITIEEANVQGIADIASLLRTQTVANGSPQITAATSSAFVQQGGTGVESISLRGLGANRTLTLLNGRRAGPAGTRGAVSAFDFNVIPLSAVERVEILKDGASSIYGSDAVAGVINVITRQGGGGDFNVFYSHPFEDGGAQSSVDGSWGVEFDRGWVRATGSYYHQEELTQGNRTYFKCAEDYVFNLDGSRADILDPRTGEAACNDLPWGHVWFYDYTAPGLFDQPWQGRPSLIQYDYDGDLSQYIPTFGPTGNSGLAAPSGWFPVGYGELLLPGAPNDPFYTPFARAAEGVTNGDHPFQDAQSLIPDVERGTAFFNGEYSVTDSITAYGEALLNRRKTTVNGYRQFWTYQYVYNYGAPFIGGDPIALAEGWSATLGGLSPTTITDHNQTRITVDYTRFVAGLRGDFGANAPSWQWDAHAQVSRSEGEYDQDIVFDDAISPYQFRTSLCAGTMTPIRGVPCVDINWYTPEFLAGNFTQEERDFLLGTAVGETIYTQSSAEGFASGELFDLPAGPISAAIGVQTRRDEIDDQPAEEILSGNAWGFSTAGRTQGRQTTNAFYGELGIPLLKDVPLAEALDLTVSARYTDIESVGQLSGSAVTVSENSTTYKVGLGWQVIPPIRLRASYGTSFRSPALFELFLGNQSSFIGQRVIDPCVNWAANLANNSITQRVADNCAADNVPATHNGSGSSATVLARGGALTNLQSETSVSQNLGIIWSPAFADLQVSVDYFDIEIENEVNQLGATNILLGCYSSTNFATDPLCDLFTRNSASSNAAFLINTVQDDFINVSTQVNSGIDVELLYRRDTPWGDLTLGTQHTFTIEDEIQLLPTSAPRDFNGEGGDPEWVGNFNATLDTGP